MPAVSNVEFRFVDGDESMAVAASLPPPCDLQMGRSEVVLWANHSINAYRSAARTKV